MKNEKEDGGLADHTEMSHTVMTNIMAGHFMSKFSNGAGLELVASHEQPDPEHELELIDSLSKEINDLLSLSAPSEEGADVTVIDSTVPRYQRPTFASELPISSNMERERLVTSFGIGSCHEIRRLPTKLRAGEIASKRTENISKNRAAGPLSVHRPSYTKKYFRPLEYQYSDYEKFSEKEKNEIDTDQLKTMALNRKPFVIPRALPLKIRSEDIFTDREFRVADMGPGSEPVKIESTIRPDLFKSEAFRDGFFYASSKKVQEASRADVRHWVSTLHAKIAEDWPHLKFTVRYTVEDEIQIVFFFHPSALKRDPDVSTLDLQAPMGDAVTVESQPQPLPKQNRGAADIVMTRMFADHLIDRFESKHQEFQHDHHFHSPQEQAEALARLEATGKLNPIAKAAAAVTMVSPLGPQPPLQSKSQSSDSMNMHMLPQVPANKTQSAAQTSSLPLLPPGDALGKYMKRLANAGVAADLKLKRRGDRWKVVEPSAATQSVTLADPDAVSLLFTFYAPWINRGPQTVRRRMADEQRAEANRNALRTKQLAKERKERGEEPRQRTWKPPISPHARKKEAQAKVMRELS
jgi:hypothetical protein